jgi:cobyrinic acid a,c-diamide synthase
VGQAIQQAVGVVEKHLDLEVLWDLARQVPVLGTFGEEPTPDSAAQPAKVRIGVCRDAAFQFYYPENLEALVREGGSLIDISPLRDPELPDVDGLYIGGGFPETLATTLADNASFRDSVRKAIEAGLPVYAECGGAVYLGEQLQVDDRQYPMVGIFPVGFALQARPQGHGYVALDVVGENPFFAVGESIRGHEFHYTCIQPPSAKDRVFAFRVRRGYGFDGRHDGLCRHNVLASYTHVHAQGTETWAPSLIRAAVRFKSQRNQVGAGR